MNGSIPKEIGNLKKLSAITLQHNRFTGIIPPSVGNLGMLKRLDLSFNQLSGSIPFTIADPPELKILDLQNNTLSGVVPPGKFPVHFFLFTLDSQYLPYLSAGLSNLHKLIWMFSCSIMKL